MATTQCEKLVGKQSLNQMSDGIQNCNPRDCGKWRSARPKELPAGHCGRLETSAWAAAPEKQNKKAVFDCLRTQL